MAIEMPKEMGKKASISGYGKNLQKGTNVSTGDSDVERWLSAMEKGSKVIKVRLGKQWNTTNRQFCLNRETRRIVMYKLDGPGKYSNRPKYGRSKRITNGILDVQMIFRYFLVDIRQMKECFSLDYKLNHSKIVDKWRKDKDLSLCDPARILIIYHGTQFVLNCLVVLSKSVYLSYCRMPHEFYFRLFLSGVTRVMSDLDSGTQLSHSRHSDDPVPVTDRTLAAEGIL